MAGAFINGPITPPNLRVEQIFRLRDPLVPDSGLPVVVIGVNRQVVFDELVGAYEGLAVDLPLTSLATYSATLVELAAIAYKDADDSTAYATPSLPDVIFRHPQFGDKTIPKKDAGAGILGWTFSQVDGEFTLDAGITFDYSVLTGVGDLSAKIVSLSPTTEANAGYRTFDALAADFIGSGIVAGDILVLSAERYTVIQVVNETQLVVEDLEDSLTIATATHTDASFTIEKTVGDGGSVYVSYVANRADMANRLISVERDTVDELFGEESILDPLGFYVRMALKNTNTTVLALQVGSDDGAGHTTAMGVLETSEVPYDLVPLTQDEDILNNYIAHVNLMSTTDKAKERRVITNFPLVLFETKAVDGTPFAAFGTGGAASNRTVAGSLITRVTAGQDNLHMRGVVQGNVFRDKTVGYEGEARIVSVTPAGANPDDDVTLALATPNTLKLFGTPAHENLNFSSAAAQVVGVALDAEVSVPGNTVVLTIDGVTTTFVASAAPSTVLEFQDGSGVAGTANASLYAKLTAFYGARLNITYTGGVALVYVREINGGHLNTAAGVPAAVTGAMVITQLDGVTPVTTAGYMDYEATAGVKATNTFLIDDDTIPVTTFTFYNDQTTENGSLIAANSYAIQIGGPVMSALNICARVAAAINAAGLDVTAEVVTSLVDVMVTSNKTGALGGVILSAPVAPVTIVSVVAGIGAVSGSPITDWEVTTKTLTVDEQATYVAQIARDLNNRRVMNVWPDICDERFEDLSAGEQLQQQGYGIFAGRTVIMENQPNYGTGVMLMAARSNLLAADPLTKRPLLGPYDLHRIDDYFTQAQLDRILSTGTMLGEQMQGAGGTIQVIRGVTTDTSDLKVVEENVGAAVDKFTRLVRQTTKPIFGPNVIDPDGNFFELFSTKVQAVITKMTRRESREARDILIVRIYENPDRKDSVIMEVEFTPLFGANDGIVKIYI